MLYFSADENGSQQFTANENRIQEDRNMTAPKKEVKEVWLEKNASNKTRKKNKDVKAKMRRLPQALIIGAMKCGTGALLHMLSIHPQIQIANGEMHFFNKDENYKKGLKWYKNKMPQSSASEVNRQSSLALFKFLKRLYLYSS